MLIAAAVLLHGCGGGGGGGGDDGPLSDPILSGAQGESTSSASSSGSGSPDSRYPPASDFLEGLWPVPFVAPAADPEEFAALSARFERLHGELMQEVMRQAREIESNIIAGTPEGSDSRLITDRRFYDELQGCAITRGSDGLTIVSLVCSRGADLVMRHPRYEDVKVRIDDYTVGEGLRGVSDIIISGAGAGSLDYLLTSLLVSSYESSSDGTQQVSLYAQNSYSSDNYAITCRLLADGSSFVMAPSSDPAQGGECLAVLRGVVTLFERLAV